MSKSKVGWKSFIHLRPLEQSSHVGTESVHRQDSSRTHIFETVHRQNWRQLADKFEDSSPTKNTFLWVLMKKKKKYIFFFLNKRFLINETEINVRNYCLCCLFAKDSVTH